MHVAISRICRARGASKVLVTQPSQRRGGARVRLGTLAKAGGGMGKCLHPIPGYSISKVLIAPSSQRRGVVCSKFFREEGRSQAKCLDPIPWFWGQGRIDRAAAISQRRDKLSRVAGFQNPSRCLANVLTKARRLASDLTKARGWPSASRAPRHVGPSPSWGSVLAWAAQILQPGSKRPAVQLSRRLSWHPGAW